MASDSPADPKTRAERRASLRFGRVASFEELERADLEFWSRATLGEKFQATLELVRDSWILEGHDGPVPRLDRHVGGVRKLRG